MAIDLDNILKKLKQFDKELVEIFYQISIEEASGNFDRVSVLQAIYEQLSGLVAQIKSDPLNTKKQLKEAIIVSDLFKRDYNCYA